MIFNYIRVSTIHQNTARQLVGVPCDREYLEKVSAKDMQRPQLQALLNNLRPGDIINVHSLDRLCRNVKDLLTILEEIKNKGATIKFHSEGLVFEPNTNNPFNTAITVIISAMAEMERNLILERVREGCARAKLANKYKGRQPKLSEIQINELQSMIGKYPRSKIAKHFGITTRSTYHYAPAQKKAA